MRLSTDNTCSCLMQNIHFSWTHLHQSQMQCFHFARRDMVAIWEFVCWKYILLLQKSNLILNDVPLLKCILLVRKKSIAILNKNISISGNIAIGLETANIREYMYVVRSNSFKNLSLYFRLNYENFHFIKFVV